jgi:hypothetical protein
MEEDGGGGSPSHGDREDAPVAPTIPPQLLAKIKAEIDGCALGAHADDARRVLESLVGGKLQVFVLAGLPMLGNSVYTERSPHLRRVCVCA